MNIFRCDWIKPPKLHIFEKYIEFRRKWLGLVFFKKKFGYLSIIKNAKYFAKISKENWKNDFRLIVIPEISLKLLYFHQQNRLGYPDKEPEKKNYQKLNLRFSVEHRKNKKIPYKLQMCFINMKKCMFRFCENPISSSYFL